MLGDEYIFQHVLRELKQRAEERAYQIYMTDAMHAVLTVLTMGKTAIPRFADLTAQQQAKPETRTAEEIKQDVLARINAGREV